MKTALFALVMAAVCTGVASAQDSRDSRPPLLVSGKIADAVELGDDGRFLFPRMRPGEYRLALVDDAEPDEWRDPEFLRRLAAASVPISLAEGEKRVQDLRVR